MQYYEGLEDKSLDSFAKVFDHNAKESPDHRFLGTRDETQPGRPYTWKTYGECNEISNNLARGCQKLGLVPTVIGEYDEEFKFMGIYSKNREEWILTDLANCANTVTTIAFYDTLGPAAVEFVIQ